MDPSGFSLVPPERFAQVAAYLGGLVRERTGRNQPCPCGSGKKYKACCLGKDTGTERFERLLDGAPLVPASIEFDLPGVTEHVAGALRGAERVVRFGDRFESATVDPEPVEWALAALAALGRSDVGAAQACLGRAFSGRFDTCLDYVNLSNRVASEPGADAERIWTGALEKVEAYRPHPFEGQAQWAVARTNLAHAIAEAGRLTEAAAVLAPVATVDGLSAAVAIGAAMTAVSVDRGELGAAIVDRLAGGAAAARARRLLVTRVLPSGRRVVAGLSGPWTRALAGPGAKRRCPSCGAHGLKGLAPPVQPAFGGAWCPACGAVAVGRWVAAENEPYPEFGTDLTALGAHLGTWEDVTREVVLGAAGARPRTR